MAVDYLHRLVVTGPHRNVREFRRGMYRKYPRTVAGGTWTEFVPFSFIGLYELAPAARRVEAEIPEDPYELSVWPIRRLDDRRSEVRYQFQTRNLEMPGLVRPLSRAFSSLTFTLLTLGLDDSSVDSYSFRRGRVRKWFIPQDRQDFHWERARKKFGLVDDEVYDDDSAEHWVEEEMLDEALRHWNGARTGTRRRYQWWNQLQLRDLATERELAIYEVIAAMQGEPAPRKRRARTRSAHKKRRARAKSR